MRYLIVHAHHEAQSLNGALTRAAVRALREAGHEVQVSDLYAMDFDPVSDRRNFVTRANAQVLRQHDEEELASRVNGYVPELQREMDKLAWCDILVFQFPLWWFGLPAILKGWVDRVFAVGRAYGGGRWFENGVLRGKRAMLSVTVGGSAAMFSEQGINGPIEQVLFPIQHGILGFVGFDVMEPFVVYRPKSMDDIQRAACVAAYQQRVLDLAGAPLCA